MPDTNALPLNLMLSPPCHTLHTPYNPMSNKPIANRDTEHNCALQADSLTNTHNIPISTDAMVAAKNALRYPLFMRYTPAGARIISPHPLTGNTFLFVGHPFFH